MWLHGLRSYISFVSSSTADTVFFHGQPNREKVFCGMSQQVFIPL